MKNSVKKSKLNKFSVVVIAPSKTKSVKGGAQADTIIIEEVVAT